MPKDVDSVVRSIQSSIYKKRAAGDTDPTTRRKLSTMVKGCGWQKRTAKRMGFLSEAISEGGLFPTMDIRPLGLDLGATIEFAERPWRLRPLIFRDERALGDYLSRHPEVLDGVLQSVGKLRILHGGHTGEIEYPHIGGGVKPDLVLIDEGESIVVVELELGGPKDNSLDQIEKYVAAVERRYGDPVQGLLITARPPNDEYFAEVRTKLRRLQADRPNIFWFCYDVDFRLEPAD